MSSTKSKADPRQRINVKIQLRLEGGLKVVKAIDFHADMALGSEIFIALESALIAVKRDVLKLKK